MHWESAKIMAEKIVEIYFYDNKIFASAIGFGHQILISKTSSLYPIAERLTLGKYKNFIYWIKSWCLEH